MIVKGVTAAGTWHITTLIDLRPLVLDDIETPHIVHCLVRSGEAAKQVDRVGLGVVSEACS